jgi:hypothetical protein
MEFHQGNIDIINISPGRYKFKDNEKYYEFDLTIKLSYLDETLDFTLLVEEGLLTYKASLNLKEFPSYQLFQESKTIDQAALIIEECFLDKMVILYTQNVSN